MLIVSTASPASRVILASVAARPPKLEVGLGSSEEKLGILARQLLRCCLLVAADILVCHVTWSAAPMRAFNEGPIERIDPCTVNRTAAI